MRNSSKELVKFCKGNSYNSVLKEPADVCLADADSEFVWQLKDKTEDA
jgi:hypothetical protein